MMSPENLHPKLLVFAKYIYLIGAILMAMFSIVAGVWLCDRKPPFEMYGYVAPSVKQGEMLHVKANVRRDIYRECSVTFSRSLFDEQGRRYWESPEYYVSPEGLRELNRQMKGDLELLLAIPDYAPPGKTTLVTNLKYICNPIHQLWPIETSTVVETIVTQ